MSQKNELINKSKKLPCNKRKSRKEEINNKKKVKKSPTSIRKKISSSISTKVKKVGLYSSSKNSKYVNIPEMVKNLEVQFSSEMSWENYGTYWSIDHIIPQCLFDFTCEDQVRACWSIENVRPLLKEENAKKANRLNMNLIREYGLQHILKKII